MLARWRRLVAAVHRRGAAALIVLAEPAGHLVRALPGLTGLLLLSYGAWMAYHPAGLITAGGLLLADRIAVDRRRNRKPGGGV